MRPVIAISTGEPAGIGPDVALTAVAARRNHDDARCVLLGDEKLLIERARGRAIANPLVPYSPEGAVPSGSIEFIDIPLRTACRPGTPDARNAPAVLAMLDRAIEGAMAGEFAAVVTAPLQKSTINEAGIAFVGHTEYLAEHSQSEHVVMMLVGGGLRVALATTHLALAAVPAAITATSLDASLHVLTRDLALRFGLPAPRIAVTGLNPHAGEGGYLGREEIEVIAPAIARARARGWHVDGPFPADTLFQKKYLDHYDAVLAMYHDQGLTVLKFASFGQGVNVTLGLPFVRTSVDHGTALDLASGGAIDSGSMTAALELAIKLAGHDAAT